MGSVWKSVIRVGMRGLGLCALASPVVALSDGYLTPWDLQAGDAFGSAIDLNTDWLLVGSPLDDLQGVDSGSVAAFHSGSNRWEQQDLIKAPDSRPGDHFGASVAISGTLCAVGAPQSGERGWRSGAVYLFQLEGGIWSHSQTLYAPNAAPGDNFGHALDLDGTTLAVGARFADGRESDSGAVFLFGLPKPADNGLDEELADEGKLVFHQRLRAPREHPSGEFGFALSIHGNDLAIGSWGAVRDDLVCGAAYIYGNEQGTWRLHRELWAPLPEDGACFGLSVNLSDGRCAIGAPWEQNGEAHSGGAYIWKKGADGWEMEEHLRPRTPMTEGCFGIAVHLGPASEQLLIGSRRGSKHVAGAGSASYFQFRGQLWSERKFWHSPAARAGDDFGLALALSSTQVLIGARRGNSDGKPGHGGCLFMKDLFAAR